MVVTTISADRNVYSQDQEFWDKYIAGRAKVPQSLFDLIFDYHAKGGSGSFDMAHEVGAGVGVHSPRLAAKFKHVLVSEIDGDNVKVAQARLEGPYSFKTSSLEDTIDLPAESIDFVFASTMMHFVDVEKAIKAVYHQLKPGGTFAAASYGAFALHDPEAQRVWTKINSLVCEMIIVSYDKGIRGRVKEGLRREASGLDYVTLPEEWFLPALRCDYNFPTEETLREMILPKGIPELVTKIGPNDVVRKEWDEGWFSSLNIEGLKRIVSTYPHDSEAPEMVELWDELHRVIGEGEVRGAWLVNVLLATKKGGKDETR